MNIQSVYEEFQRKLENYDPTDYLYGFSTTKYSNKGQYKHFWILDSSSKLGQLKLHYEIRELKDHFILEVHFDEGQSKGLFLGNHLAANLHIRKDYSWKKWRKVTQRLLLPGINLNDSQVIEKLEKQLIDLDKDMGDLFREIADANGERLLIDTAITKYNRMKEDNKKQDHNNIEISNDNVNEEGAQSKNHHPLNQILFGPPGTGKTFNSVNRALEVIGEKIVGKSRKDIKALFNLRMKEGQIMFTTFHQSMSYEDFIEGIKPIAPKVEGQQINYVVEDGLFKLISKAAKENRDLAQLKTKEAKTIPFDTAFEILKQKIETGLLEDPDNTPNEMKRGYVIDLASSFFSITGINGKSIRMMTRTGNEQNTMTKPTLQLMFEDSKNVEKYVTGGMRTYYKALLDEMYSWKPDIQNISENVELKNYVLIIDEINRGNVSQIFGELITLIEEDKRLGNTEALESTLPYSKDRFGVPPNLFLIGTMNTADRSVEALDAALRRRFSFEEMQPKYNLTELNYEYMGIKANDLLKTINDRIEKLLDKDHKIGHSYFILNETENIEVKLITSFYKSIIPLLQEYFFGDFGKIGLVLGDGFVSLKEWDESEESFADFNSESASDYEDRPVYDIIDYRRKDLNYTLRNNEKKEIKMTFEKAIMRLMKLDFD